MKPKNFPARKLRRQLNAANNDYLYSDINDEAKKQLAAARNIRTKKNRTNRAA